MATARFMETWAHGLDVADAPRRRAGAHRPDPARRPPRRTHPRLRLPGARARAAGRGVPGRAAPRRPASCGTWGPADAAQRCTGSAYDFCLRVTQRRHRDDLDLVADRRRTPTAWLDIAQAFAGPPGDGRGRRVAVAERARGPARRQLQRASTATGSPPCGRCSRAATLDVHHRRLPGRADHADPGQGPAQGPVARLCPHLRDAGRRLPRRSPWSRASRSSPTPAG